MSFFFVAIMLSVIPATELFACGPYYPHGEAVRFQLLKPNGLGYEAFAPFYYSVRGVARMHSGKGKALTDMGRRKNVRLWQERPEEQIDRQTIYDALYKGEEEVGEGNPFLEYLENDPEAKAYLSFAKKCSEYNRFNSYDPWEKDFSIEDKERKKALIEKALTRAEELDDERLKLRYRFLAVRLAYYSKEKERVRELYEDHFRSREAQNILDHWARYFMTKSIKDGAERNYQAARVFAEAPDKRFKVHYCYDRSVPIEKTLGYADNQKERAAVWLLHGIVHPGPALKSIRKLYELDPGSKGLSFLLLRELNKLEDWIQTPYYTQLQPGLCMKRDRSDYETAGSTRERVEKDRRYAQKLLDLVENADISGTYDPSLWRTGKSYLQLMLRKPELAVEGAKRILKRTEDGHPLQKGVRRIKALARVAAQPEGEAALPSELEAILMRNEDHPRFIFAIARELEYKGAHIEGAVLLSAMSEREHRWGSDLYWRSKKRHHTLFQDFYSDYFYYVDATFSPEQTQKLIADVQEGKKREGEFAEWKYGRIGEELTRLHELMGTKWIRRDSLRKAKASFERVDDTLWQSEHYPFRHYFDKDPFSWEWYNNDISIRPDSLNKEKMTEELLEELALAKDPDHPDRDLAYYRVANAYNNMSYFGNAWMMRRYFRTIHRSRSGLIDDEEYARGKRAQHYYQKAAELSDNEKFSALCLAMAGMCRDRGLRKELREEYDDLSYTELLEKQEARNEYYQRIKADYPSGTYKDLMSKCLFSRYEKARFR